MLSARAIQATRAGDRGRIEAVLDDDREDDRSGAARQEDRDPGRRADTGDGDQQEGARGSPRRTTRARAAQPRPTPARKVGDPKSTRVPAANISRMNPIDDNDGRGTHARIDQARGRWLAQDQAAPRSRPTTTGTSGRRPAGQQRPGEACGRRPGRASRASGGVSSGRRNRRGLSRTGSASAAATAASDEAGPIAIRIAPSSDPPAIAPARPEPIGKPRKLNDIDTAKARPIQAGSVRRWRRVNIATSSGPLRITEQDHRDQDRDQPGIGQQQA